MIVGMSNSAELFNVEYKIFDNKSISQMLDKLAEQEKELRILQQNLLKERHAKESLQSDFEHALDQLKLLQKFDVFTKKIDLAYI